MLARSHMALGLLGGVAVSFATEGLSKVFGIEISREFYFGILLPFVIFGSVFPDIDEPRSFIGRKLPLISHIVSLSFSHRGFTHFLIFPLIFVVIALFLASSYKIAALCLIFFSFGILLHQIGDMLTISGIPYYFFPLSKTKAVLLPKIFRFKTGGVVEQGVLYGILLPAIAFFGMERFGMGGSVDKVLKMISHFGGLS